jgi:hypothetical protein
MKKITSSLLKSLGMLGICMMSIHLSRAQNVYLQPDSGYSLILKSGNAQRMTLFSNGNFQINVLNTGVTGLAGYSTTGVLQPLNFNGDTTKFLRGNGTFANISSYLQWSQLFNNLYYTAGSIGVGTSTPDAPLNVSAPDTTNGIEFSVSTPSSHQDVFTVDTLGNTIINGKVIIGSASLHLTTPGPYGLYVGGGILAEQVKVALHGDATNWSDYVFAGNYKLNPLSEVEKFIRQNHHLSGVPSADEVQNGGIDVATMDATLLKKIEELTLYVIALNKKVEQLEAEKKQTTKKQMK